MIEIDGNYAEGGGSIIRVALALSAVTQKPFRACDIRKGRSQPGLKAQHLHAIHALSKLCGAKTVGAVLGSESIEFYPAKIKSSTLSIDIGTAGSITLLLQALMLPSLFAKRVKISLIGGSDVSWSPQIDYFSSVFLPHLKKYAKITLQLKKRGYFPKGGGNVEMSISSAIDSIEEGKNHPIDLTTLYDLNQIQGISHASSDLPGVASRQAESAKSHLRAISCPVNIDVQETASSSLGSGITLWAQYSQADEIPFENPLILGSDVLGEKKKKAEMVGEECAKNLISLMSAQAPVDPHLCDQLIPYLALFGGSLRTSEITDHTKANIYVCEKFLGTCLELDGSKVQSK